MARSAAPLVAALMALVLVSAPYAEATITCGQVVGALGSCIKYLQGAGPLPASCCAGIKSLNAAANTTPDRQAACGCLKMAAARTRYNPALASGLPGKCGVSLPYPISSSVNCASVH